MIARSLLISAILTFPVCGQDVQFQHINVDNGLSQNSVTTIIQDSQGFIWFGTQYGLNKYDGYNIEVFVPEEGNEGSSVGNEVWSLLEDSKGRIWVGTNEGVNIFDKESYSFQMLSTETKEGKRIEGTISYILEDDHADFWIGTVTKGIYKLDEAENTLTHYEITRNDPQVSATSFRIWAMYMDSNEILWAGTWNQGLVRLDTKSDTFEYLTTLNSGLKSNDIRTFLMASDSLVWIGTRSGMQQLNVNSNKVTPTTNKELNHLGFIQNTLRDNSGRIWVATWGDGLYLYDKELKFIDHLYHEEDNPHSLSGNLIFSFLQDRTGCLWIGTWTTGVNKYCPDKVKFTCCPKYDLKNIIGIAGDRNSLLLGTYGEGLYLLDENKEEAIQIKKDLEPPQGILNRLILDIENAGDGSYWIGYNGSGFSRFDVESQSFENFIYDQDAGYKGGLNSGSVARIVVGSTGDILLGTGGGGLNLYNPKDQSYRYITTTTHPAISSNRISALLEDRNNNIWIGTRGGGLNKLDPSLQSATTYKNIPDSINSLSNNHIEDIWEDEDGILWIATKLGFNALNPETGKIERYTEKHGLANNWVYSILEDDKGRLWLSTNGGLSVFDPINKSFTNYDVQDGLQSNEFNAGAKYKSKDGKLYFGGINGFNAFYPDEIFVNTKEPNVVITSLEILNEPVPIGKKESESYTIPKHISQLSKLVLSHRESVISLEFSALHFVNPQKNSYQYKLEGFEEDWVKAGTRHFISYTNLDPGDYTFRLKGANSDGHWGSREATLGITVLPPPWKTWWAYSLYALVIVGGIAFGVRAFIVRERLKNNLNLEQLELQKAHELDQIKSRFFAGISHEFRTPLTLISAPIKELIKKHDADKETRQNLIMVDQNADRLLDLINQLLDLSKLEAGKLSLKVAKDDINKFLRIISASFQSLAESRKIDFKLNITDEPFRMYFDREKIEHIVVNLLSNAFKFSGFGAKVEFEAFGKNDVFQISISDTGSGIPQHELEHVFDRFYQVEQQNERTSEGSGIGLALVKELVELHHGSITVESSENISTTFTVQIPCIDRAYNRNEIIESTPIKETNFRRLHFEKTQSRSPLKTEGDKPVILVVEDNEELREYIGAALIASYSILTAKNGLEALEKAASIPDLIISDLMMPIMDGQEMLEQLKCDPKTNHIPVILLTAKANRDSKLEGLDTGADHYVNKPFDMDELRVRAKSLIAQRARVRDHYYKEFLSSPATEDIQSADNRFLKKAMEVLEKHLSDASFSVDQFARELAMSRVQLHRKLKAIIGCSTTEFIREVRLKKAWQYLKEKKGTVSEIAYEVGFNNLSYFAKCFKKSYGLNPSELL